MVVKKINKIKRMQIDMPKTLDPVKATDTISREIIDAIFDKLVVCRGNRYELSLANKIWNKNNEVYWCELRKNIKFSDGSDCNSESVTKSLKRMLKHSAKAANIFEGILRPEGIKCKNSYEIQFTLEMPYNDFEKLLAISEASIAKLKNNSDNKMFPCNYLGTGPYKICRYNDLKKIIVLEKNIYFWGKESNIDEIEVCIDDNYENIKYQFIHGDVDIINAKTSDIDEFKIHKNIETTFFPSFDMSLFVINQSRKHLSNKYIRRIIQECFDSNKYLMEIKKGNGYLVNSAIPVGIKYHATDIVNKKMTNEELSQNLFKYKDIISQMKELEIITFNGLVDADIACSMLTNVLIERGFKCRIVKTSFQEYCDKFDRGDFDIAFLAWAPDSVDPYSYVCDFYSKKGEVSSAIKYHNRNIEEMIYKIRKCNNSDNSRRYYEKIQEIAESDNLYIWIFQGLNLKVYKKHICGIEHSIMDGDYCYRNMFIKDVNSNE